MFLRVLAEYEKAHGLDHASILNIVSNLGTLYAKRGKHEEAEAMYWRALARYEKAFGLDNTSTLNVVCNLGLLYKDPGKQKMAEAMLERAGAGKSQPHYRSSSTSASCPSLIHYFPTRSELMMNLSNREYSTSPCAFFALVS